MIVVTGTATYLQHLVDLCVEVGATDGMTKPIDLAELLQKIRRALGEEAPAHA